jgi:hypothetical protein
MQKAPAKPVVKRVVKTVLPDDYRTFKRNNVVLSLPPQDLAKLIELARDQKHRLTTYDWDDLHDRLSYELTSHISVWG